ncbi:hypothetical protein [Cystobacter fuscus]|uniref:hypothetical protein n=1 Tax=Cystobacter fuscus TaxID=43 RepID=UPI001E2EC5C6|nr:hypothetical protein [Cystobacter fuscus]
MQEGLPTYRLGYVANCLSLGLGASHTCRLASATPHRLEQLIELNLSDSLHLTRAPVVRRLLLDSPSPGTHR